MNWSIYLHLYKTNILDAHLDLICKKSVHCKLKLILLNLLLLFAINTAAFICAQNIDMVSNIGTKFKRDSCLVANLGGWHIQICMQLIVLCHLKIIPCHFNNSLSILFLESLLWFNDTMLDTGTIMMNQFLHNPVFKQNKHGSYRRIVLLGACA